MKKNIYTTAEEITKKFIEDGWDAKTTFSELTMEEAIEKGCLFAIAGINRGHKYFKMNISGNIYDENGKIVMYNLKIAKNTI